MREDGEQQGDDDLPGPMDRQVACSYCLHNVQAGCKGKQQNPSVSLLRARQC